MAERVVCHVTDVDDELAKRDAGGWSLVAVVRRTYVSVEYDDDDTSQRYPHRTKHEVRELYFERRKATDAATG